MWIFAKKGFLSIVEDRESEGFLLVRSRFKGDIEVLFPGVQAEETRMADYRYRARLPRDVVARAITQQIREIDYPNFKAAIEDQARHFDYMAVWDIMTRAQNRCHGIACWDDFDFKLWPDDETDLFRNGPFYVSGGRT